MGMGSHLQGAWMVKRDHPKEGGGEGQGWEGGAVRGGRMAEGVQSPVSPKPREGRCTRKGMEAEPSARRRH